MGDGLNGLGYEGEVLVNGMSALIEEIQRVSPFCPMRTQGEEGPPVN